MRKRHWFQDGKPTCRPNWQDDLQYDPALSIPTVTCTPCLKGLGLTKDVLKATARSAKLTLVLPNGTHPVCLVENWEMRIEASTAMRQEAGKPDQFLGPEPEPINLKATLTEDGWDVLKQAMIGK